MELMGTILYRKIKVNIGSCITFAHVHVWATQRIQIKSIDEWKFIEFNFNYINSYLNGRKILIETFKCKKFTFRIHNSSELTNLHKFIVLNMGKIALKRKRKKNECWNVVFLLQIQFQFLTKSIRIWSWRQQRHWLLASPPKMTWF